jgi:heme exporter protein A
MTIDGIRVEKVTKTYGRQRALHAVTLELRAGGMCALLGPNGAGKSTLIGVLSTLVRPEAGKVVYGDGKLAARDVRARIGMLAHESFVYGELDAIENLEFWGRLYEVADAPARAPALLDEVGLDAVARRRPVRTYSRGMLQRVALARALLAAPQVLLLDEPFTGLDRAGAAALAKAIAGARERGCVLVCATHDLEAIAGLTDQIVVLKAGKVALDERGERPFGLDELKQRYLSLVS